MLEQISETETEWAMYLSREDAMRQQLSVEYHLRELNETVAKQSDQIVEQSGQIAEQSNQIAEQSDQLAEKTDQIALLRKFVHDPSAFSQEERQRLLKLSDGS